MFSTDPHFHQLLILLIIIVIVVINKMLASIVGVEWYFIVVVNDVFLMTNVIDHFPNMLICSMSVFFDEVCVQIISLFCNCLFLIIDSLLKLQN